MPDTARLRALEDENRRLKKLLAESVMDNSLLKDLLRKTETACGSVCCGEACGRRSRLLRAAGLRVDRT